MSRTSEHISPTRIFGAFILLNLILGIVVVAFPDGKIPLGKDYSLSFVPFQKLFQKDSTIKVDAKEIIAEVVTVDTNLVALNAKELDKLKNEKIEVAADKKIQYPNESKSSMLAFFKALYNLETSKDSHIRIIHYGDSQLEGDRISDYLRNRLQLLFGGWGPGIVLPIDISNSRISVRQSESKNWIKSAIYGNTPKAESGLYGIGASSYKFTGEIPESIKKEIKKVYSFRKVMLKDSTFIQEVDSSHFVYDTSFTKKPPLVFDGAWINLLNAKNSYPRVRQYNTVSLLYSAKEPFYIKLTIKDGKEITEMLPEGLAKVKTWNVGEVNTGVNLSFSGKSPTVFGVALDGSKGITVDNFPMRGSSALGFDKINREMLDKLYHKMNVKLIIMEYGINLVPNPAKSYDWFARMFSKQLEALKAAAPDVSILVIGPSDMSMKTAEGFASYPNIPLINEAMRKAAFENGCAFWDLYQAMGGQNSMSSWVENKLAAKDYTHFSTSGARFVSEMLYNALMEEYQLFVKNKENL